MRLTLKRILQAFFLVLLFSFSTLAVLRTWSASNRAVVEEPNSSDSQWINSIVKFWPDRSLRSVWYEEGNTVVIADELNATDINLNTIEETEVNLSSRTPVTKAPTTLDDIFISVKTTKNFHVSRLDVIIKTWFTLAREQVFRFLNDHLPSKGTFLIVVPYAELPPRLPVEQR